MARGVVRCGSCLQVFNAAKQLLEQAGKEPVAPVVPAIVEAPPPAEPRAISQKQWTAAELTSTASTSTKSWPDSSSGKSSRPRSSPGIAKTSPAPVATPPRPKSLWSDSLFSESAADRAQTEEEDLPEPEQVPNKPSRTEPSLSLEPVEPEDEATPPQLRLHDPLDTPVHHERSSATASDEHDDDLPSIEPLRKRRERSEPGVRTDVLQDLTDDPLQLDWQQRRSPWGRRLFWLLLIVLGAGALVGQYVAYHFDELARQDQYRPWFQQLCPHTGCTVPSKVDIAKIKSSNLVVRSHPNSTAPWWSTRSSTTARLSPSHSRCWNCALPTSMAI